MLLLKLLLVPTLIRAFATFCLQVALAVPRIGLALGFLAALACTLLVQAASFQRR
ncbi:MAG: hypothetical protein ACYC0T_04620 [Ramlibacter sp.]